MNSPAEELWTQLQQAGVVQGTAPEIRHLESPWYVKVILAFSGWLAALFLLGFVGIGFEFIIDNSFAALITGALMCAAAYALLRTAKNEFFEHLSLAISLAGQALIVWALFDINGSNDASFWLLVAILQTSLAVFMPHFVHRVFSSFFAAFSISMAMTYLHMPYLFSAVLMFCVAWLWLNEFRYPAQMKKIRAIGYGLVLAGIYLKGSYLLSYHLLFWRTGQTAPELWVRPWMGELISGLVILYVIWELLKRSGKASPGRVAYAALTGSLLLSLVSMEAPGITMGMMIMLLGFAGGNRILLGLGIVSLLSYISSYYYLLDTTLLAKSQTLLAVGLVLLLLRWIFTRVLADEQEASNV